MHAQDLRKSDVSFEKMLLVPAWREAGEVFTARERACLAWAESLALVADSGVPDSAYLSASAVFNDKELADLSVAIALMSAFNRLGVAFRNEPVTALKLAREARDTKNSQ
jgi:alkylhydroperoxidase family enzyme